MNIKTVVVRSIMFISSYAPLYVFLLILQYDQLGKWRTNNLVLGFIILMVIFILISVFSIWCIKKSPLGNTYKIKNIKQAKENIISYVFTYIVPILSVSIEKPPIAIVNLLLFILVWLLYIKLNLVYLNPLWTIFGFITYEDDDKYIISDIRYDDLKRLSIPLKGIYLVNNVFLAKKKDNGI